MIITFPRGFMKTGSEIEEEINSSTKGRGDASQASSSPCGSNWPGSQHANCSALATAHAAFCLLGLLLGTCQELHFSSCKKPCFSASPDRYHAQPEVQTLGQSSHALIRSITGMCGNSTGLRENNKPRDSY